MKSFLLLSSLFFSLMISAQDVEEQNDVLFQENSRNINRLEIQEPFYQLPIKGCTNLNVATFEGGVSAYKKLLSKYMYNYLNSDLYRLNGDFSFILTIDENGKITDLKCSPNIPNSKFFFDDMEYIFRRIRKNWSPATCNGKPISSQIKIKIKFSSMSVDID
jgi:hypothetical protein